MSFEELGKEIKGAVWIIVIGAYVLGVAYWMRSIETEFNVPFVYAFKHFSIPITILTAYVVFKYPRLIVQKGTTKKWALMLWSLFIGSMMTLSLGPYMSWANASLDPQEEVIVEGQIVRKFKTGKHDRERVVVLDTENTSGKPYQLYVTHEQYDRAQLGDTYRGEFTQGGLGFIYRWRR